MNLQALSIWDARWHLAAGWACVVLMAMALPTTQTWANDATVQAIAVPNEPITLTVGQRKAVTPQVTPAAADVTLRYESGNTGFFTVDAAGVLTGVHEGVSSLSITAPNGVRREVVVEVLPADAAPPAAAPTPAPRAATSSRGVPDEGIVIANAGGNLELGGYERIIAHVLPYQVIGSNPFTITSSDPSVIQAIDEVKVIHAVREGTATVTAQTLDGRHRASATYTVVPAVVESHTDETTYRIDPQPFGLRYDDASEEAARANSAGLYRALRHTADNGFTRLLLEADKVLYIEPRDTIHMVSNVQLDLNGSEIRLRPNDYPRYVAFLFAEKDATRVLENASIVNGIITGERDHKEAHFPNWARTPATEGGCSIVFEEGYNNGIRNLTVRKSIGFNISSGLGSRSHGVRPFAQSPVRAGNLELGRFDDRGQPTEAKGQIRTRDPLDISAFTTPYYTLGYPLGYMGYPFMNSRIYDAYFFDQDMQLIEARRGKLRFRQYSLPQGAAYLHLAFYHADVPAGGNTDFGNAVAFVENRAMPIRNYMIDCVIEDNFSTGFAACGGQGWIIRNNLFRGNGGRMPGCDIDWEDGWEYMQGDLIEGNTFESRLNVITCAGVGLIFRNNTFRGESVFYGRSQHFSLLHNTFEKGDGERAHPVKVTLSSQTDIYSYGNVYRNAMMGYSRQHAREPFIGTYEATFVNETFDNTPLLRGHITRLVGCTIRNGSEHTLISADHLENCTIEQGSYLARGTMRNATIENATFRVQPEGLLAIHDSTLRNVSFTASAACQGVLIENSQITVNADQSDQLLVTPNNMSAFTLRNSQLTIRDGVSYTLVGGWNATGAQTTITLDRVRFAVPRGFEGYLYKFSWYPPADAEERVTFRVTNSNVSMFRPTDDRGQASNVVFQIPRR